MKLGYIRVSKKDQKTARQIDALRDQCDELLIERLSAVSKKRPIFDKAMDKLEPGDTFVVLDLDRAFRSTVDALLSAEKLRERGIHFKIANSSIDTTTEGGELIYGVMALFAEHERKMLKRRTREGLRAAEKRGKKPGRPRSVTNDQVSLAKRLIDEGQETVASMARTFEVDRSTLGRRIKALEDAA